MEAAEMPSLGESVKVSARAATKAKRLTVIKHEPNKMIHRIKMSQLVEARRVMRVLIIWFKMDIPEAAVTKAFRTVNNDEERSQLN